MERANGLSRHVPATHNYGRHGLERTENAQSAGGARDDDAAEPTLARQGSRSRHRRVFSQPVVMIDPVALFADSFSLFAGPPSPPPPQQQVREDGAQASTDTEQELPRLGGRAGTRTSQRKPRSQFGGTPVGRLSSDAKEEIRRTYSVTSADSSSSRSGSIVESVGAVGLDKRKSVEWPTVANQDGGGDDDDVADSIYKLRQAKRAHLLECIEFDKVGDFRVRKVSRSDILREVVLDRDIMSVENENLFFDEAMKKSKKELAKEKKSKKKRSANNRNFLRNALHARDIRQVDPAFKAKPALWVRYKAIIVSLNGVRAIILYNKMFIFEIKGRDPSTLVNIIRMRILTSDVDFDDDEELDTPFEFRALEGILIGVCLNLEHDFVKLEPPIQKIVEIVGSKISADKLESLRILEMKLNGFISRAKAVKAVLVDLLDEDEEMSNMYLTEIQKRPFEPRNPLEHEKAEILLESYLQVIDDLTSRADLLAESIDDSEGLFQIHLDAVQNRLLLVDLIISVFTLLFASGTLIGAVFGMNFPFSALWQELPSSQYFFLGVIIVYFLGFTLSVWFFLKYSKRKRLWGRTRAILAKM